MYSLASQTSLVLKFGSFIGVYTAYYVPFLSVIFSVAFHSNSNFHVINLWRCFSFLKNISAPVCCPLELCNQVMEQIFIMYSDCLILPVPTAEVRSLFFTFPLLGNNKESLF